MKLQPVSSQVPRIRTEPTCLSTPSPPIPPDTVELSLMGVPKVEAHRAEPSLKNSLAQSWWGCLQTTLQQLSGPIAPLVKTVLDVWMGGKRESSFEHVRDFADEAQARAQFEKAKTRLLNPNQWKKLGPGLAAADFKLYCDDRRKAKEGAPEVGDFLKIRLPDLGPHVWCRVESLDQKPDSLEVVVRPSPDPRENDPDIAHFFSEQTTNHFQLRRQGNQLVSRVVGRAEALNQTGHFGERLLSAVRLKGAWLGAKKPQWRSFTRKLIED